MTNKDLLRIAMAQSAADIGCRPDDFLADNNVVVPFQLNADAKKYYKLPIACNLVSYGNNIVAAAADDVSDIVKEYIGKFEFIIALKRQTCIGLMSGLPQKAMPSALWLNIIFRI